MEKNSKPNPNAVKVGKKKDFTPPQGFFNQLNEFTNGGFCLIMVNGNGQPYVYSQFDNQIVALGLQKFALDYFDAIDKIHAENVDASIYQRNLPNEDEGNSEAQNA